MLQHWCDIGALIVTRMAGGADCRFRDVVDHCLFAATGGRKVSLAVSGGNVRQVQIFLKVKSWYENIHLVTYAFSPSSDYRPGVDRITLALVLSAISLLLLLKEILNV